MTGREHDELIRLAHAWDRAMIENDAEAIGSFMAGDWVIVGPDGSVGDRASFLALVKSGDLTHDEMTSEDFRIRVYGDAAVVTTRGVSGGKYRGSAFREVERASSVFVKQSGGMEVRADAPVETGEVTFTWSAPAGVESSSTYPSGGPTGR